VEQDVDLQSVLDKELIVLNLQASTKEEVIEKLAEVLFKNDKLISKEVYIKDVLEREKHCTTGIGSGIAIPHGKSNGVKQTSIAIGKLLEEIEWQAFDKKPVKMVFLLSVKKEDTEEMHLKTISNIATSLSEDETINRLLKATTTEEIIALLCA
jgi:fructose-specific phosphotransferase system IIA component